MGIQTIKAYEDVVKSLLVAERAALLMGDGSSNILNKDSLKDFNGNYGFGN